MSMHLCSPAISLNGKKKGKVKWASAEAKRQAEQLAQEWDRLKKSHGVKETPRKKSSSVYEPLDYSVTSPNQRTTPVIPSRGQDKGVAALKPNPVYTGNMVKGISQMAKSNAVPVFNSEHIVEIARMRR